MSGRSVVGGPWSLNNPVPVVQVAGPPPNVQGWYPPTTANPLAVAVVSGPATTEQQPGEPEVRQAGIDEAPQDGRVYARRNGQWVAIGGQQG
jgi:hypothetical protein